MKHASTDEDRDRPGTVGRAPGWWMDAPRPQGAGSRCPRLFGVTP
jgi:hypothetical protein